MANIIQIDYLYREQEKMAEIIQNIALTDVSFEWDVAKNQIKIIWNWGQEPKVLELLDSIKTQFKGTMITIHNEERISKSDVKEVLNEEKVNEPVKELKEDSIEEEVILEEAVVSEEEMVTSQEEKNSLSEGEQEEKKVLANVRTDDALKEFLKITPSEYDFVLNPKEAAEKLCSKLDIKSEIIRHALVLVNKVSSEAMLMQELAKVYNNNNRAMIKVTLAGHFKKWLKSNYPSFMEENPEVNVFHFLNIFRGEKHKF